MSVFVSYVKKLWYRVYARRTDAEAETPILWPPHAKSWLIGKDPDAGKGCGQEEKGTTEDEMVGWHHWLDGHEFGWTLGAGDGQGGLVCCDSWGRKDSETTERLNWLTDWLTEMLYMFIYSHTKYINIFRYVIWAHITCIHILYVNICIYLLLLIQDIL